MREIRTLRAMWRGLETGPRQVLNGYEEGNLGHKPRRSLRAAAPVLDPTEIDRWTGGAKPLARQIFFKTLTSPFIDSTLEL